MTLLVLIACVALVYASVGRGGALGVSRGYVAVRRRACAHGLQRAAAERAGRRDVLADILAGGPRIATLAVAIARRIRAGGVHRRWAAGVGVGGGIFLSPLMILLRWADPKSTVGAAGKLLVVHA